MLREAGRLTLALLLVAGAAACSDGGGETSLPDGFSVPDGAELVGTVIPRLSEERSRDGRYHREWLAVLRIRNRPQPVYRALNEQAIAQGMPAMGLVPNACRASPRGLTCGGSSAAAHDRGTLSVGVSEPYGCVSFRKDSGPTATSSRRLDAAHRATPSEGDGWRFPGTRRIIPSNEENQVGACVTELLEVTGDPDAVWNRYRARARDASFAEELSARRYGLRVTELVSSGSGYDITITRVTPRAGPTVIAVDARG